LRRLEHGGRCGGVGHHGALGDLEAEQLRREVRQRERVLDDAGERVVRQLARGDIYADARRAGPPLTLPKNRNREPASLLDAPLNGSGAHAALLQLERRIEEWVRVSTA
jgi:hypothetical protein